MTTDDTTPAPAPADDLIGEPASRTLHLGVTSLDPNARRWQEPHSQREVVDVALRGQTADQRVLFYTDEDSYLAWGEYEADGTVHVKAEVPLMGDLAGWMPYVMTTLARLVTSRGLRVMDYAVITDTVNYSAGVQVITPAQGWTYHVGPLEGDAPGTL
jgi:hypothetical protein